MARMGLLIHRKGRTSNSCDEQKGLKHITRRIPNRIPIRRFPGRRNLPGSEVDRYIPQIRSGMDIRLGNEALRTHEATISPTHPSLIQRVEQLFPRYPDHGGQSTYLGRIANALGFGEHDKVMQFKRAPMSAHKLSIEFNPRECLERPSHHFDLTRMLDAPGLVNDFYASPISWCQGNALAVALADEIYIWRENFTPKRIPNCSASNVVCLSWSISGRVLAVGAENGHLMLWLPDDDALLLAQNLREHYGTPCCLAWKSSLIDKETEYLLVGTSTGKTLYYQCTWPHDYSLLCTAKYHADQICGIAWNCDGTQFATGANDNTVIICGVADSVITKHLVLKHNAAVKALHFCPWEKSLLMTGTYEILYSQINNAGGGSYDRKVRFFNSRSGKLEGMIDVGAQITAVIWSSTQREVCVTFGYTRSGVTTKAALYTWPELHCVGSLSMAADVRALFAVSCPERGEVIVCGSDETIRFFRLWKESTNAEPFRDDSVWKRFDQGALLR